MAITTTSITGPLLDPLGNAIANEYIYFRLKQAGADNGVSPTTVIGRTTEEVQTDTNGDFTLSGLWVNDDSDITSVYEVTTKNGHIQPTDIVIPSSASGGSIALGELLINHSVSELPDTFGGVLSGDLNANNNAITSVDELTLSTSPSGTYTAGRISWNDTDKTVNIDTGIDDVTIQVGQETMKRVRNATGSTITNGQVVRVSGAAGNRPTVVLAQADTASNADGTLGVATHDIDNNSDGFVTILGTVRDIDTSSFSAGDEVYLSASAAGELTSVEPNLSVRIGVVTVSNASSGELSVSVHSKLPRYGSIYVNGGATGQSIPTGGTYTKSTAFTTDDGDSGGIADSANDKLILTRGVWQVSASVSFESDTATELSGALFLDGSDVTSVHFEKNIPTVNVPESVLISGLIVVDQATEDLDLRIKHTNGGSVNITVSYGNITAHRINN